MQRILYFLLLISALTQCRQDASDYVTQFPGKPQVPEYIKEEHEHLLDRISALSLAEDSTGRVATRTLELMRHHFQEEEDYVLPPLAILPLLASGLTPDRKSEIIRLTEKLKSQLAHINAEHQMITAHLEELKAAAAYDNHPDVSLLAEQIYRHARAEEEVYFPAAIVAGEYLKMNGVD